MSGGPPSPALQERILLALAPGRLTTDEVATRERISHGAALAALQFLHTGGLVKRAVRRHWRRAPEEGYAEWVWRLP